MKRNLNGFSVFLLVILLAVVLVATTMAFVSRQDLSENTETDAVNQSQTTDTITHLSGLKEMNVIPYPNTPVAERDKDEPCATDQSRNIRQLSGEYTIDDKQIVFCESYLTTADNCFDPSDKAESTSLPCQDTTNGPYNLLYAYENIGDIYSLIYVAADQTLLPEKYKDSEGSWIAWATRTKSSIPDLTSRNIEGTDKFYRYEQSDTCTIGLNCINDESRTIYYSLNDKFLLELRFYTDTELTGRGG